MVILKLCRQSLEILKAFCLDMTQGHMNGAPNETRTHSEAT